MAQITIVLDVKDAEPTLLDPHDVAHRVVDTYNDERFVDLSPGHEVELVSAEWSA